jgi:mannose/cellobiose epimerase-like protein (N-acyl-D-glucosamine 2-epimerase family)
MPESGELDSERVNGSSERPLLKSFAKINLYNQAFALVAYACSHPTIDPCDGWRTRAYALIQTLSREFAHPG